MGGVGVNQLAKQLKAENINVDLMVTVDAAFGPFGKPLEIPDNVKTNLNMYQSRWSLIGSHGFPAKPQEGNSKTIILNDNWTDKTSGEGKDAHGTMDEDTQQKAENYMKVEMTGDLDGIIQDARTGSKSGGQ